MLYAFETVGSNGYLMYGHGGATPVEIVELVGVTPANFHSTDIVHA